MGLALSIGCVFSALFLALDYWIDREIYQRMDHTLLERAGAVGRALQEQDPRQLERLMPEYEPSGHTEFFTVFDAGGRTLLQSPSSAGTALSMGPEEAGTPRYFDVVLPDGHAGRALATRLPPKVGDATPRMLVVATERENWDRTERRIHFTLLGGIVLALALAVGLGLLVVQHVIAMLHHAGDKVAALDTDAPMQPIGDDFPRELKPFAEAFNIGLHRLYAAVARERRFARDVAHELRTPLAEIRISAEAALADTDPRQAQRSLCAAIDACTRMQRSVDTLLLLARLESGQDAVAPDPLDLAALVGGLIAALQDLGAARGITVRTELPPTAWVQSDLGIVERIVSNLLRNALEYSPEGTEIACRLGRDGDGWFVVIANAAPDLEAADLDHFGHRFWRKHPEGGTAHHAGLGLALTQGLAQALALPLRFSLDDGRLSARVGPWSAL
ncbi:MAG TPA: histidine kinase dimerization/phospho-acceptor domain-containing protein [Rhodanobacter sp.]